MVVIQGRFPSKRLPLKASTVESGKGIIKHAAYQAVVIALTSALRVLGVFTVFIYKLAVGAAVSSLILVSLLWLYSWITDQPLQKQLWAQLSRFEAIVIPIWLLALFMTQIFNQLERRLCKR